MLPHEETRARIFDCERSPPVRRAGQGGLIGVRGSYAAPPVSSRDRDQDNQLATATKPPGISNFVRV